MAQQQRTSWLTAVGERLSGGGASAMRLVCLAVIVLVVAVIALGSGVFASRSLTIERGDAPEADEMLGAASDDESQGEADAAKEDADVDAEAADEEDSLLVVDVSGAVKSPMVATLPAGSRVADAIEAAGGLSDDADVASINRAAPLSDGAKVYVPRVGESVPSVTGSSTGVGSGGTSGAGSAQTTLVNINTADATALDELPGVGPATAAAIIEDREANGPFVSPEDLMRVSGIGEKKYAKLKALICV